MAQMENWTTKSQCDTKKME